MFYLSYFSYITARIAGMNSMEINVCCSEAQESNEVNMKKKNPFPFILFTHIHLSMYTLFGCKAALSEVIIHGSRSSLLSSQCTSGQLHLKSLHHFEFHGLPLTLLSVSTNIPVPMCSLPLKCLVVWPRAWRISFV